jgi:ketosteroid isomerase-like protein
MRIWLLAAGLVLTSVSPSLASDWDYDSKKPMPFGKSATNASEFALQGNVREIVALEEGQIQAWNRHDLQGYFTAYLRSPELISISEGDQIVGFDAYSAEITKAYGNDPASMGQLQLDHLQVKVFSPAAFAIVRTSYNMRTPKHVYDIEVTEILRKTTDGWRIAFENDHVTKH